jgi:hypothetical protein
MGRFLISWEDLNNHSTRLKPVICSLLMTLAKSSKNAVLALGNLCPMSDHVASAPQILAIKLGISS